VNQRNYRVLAAALLALAVTWPFARHSTEPRPRPAGLGMEWPRVIDGESLRPLALSDVEARFAARFPGAIARFATDDATWILRRVERPTRMLHPAADCYRGLGYRVRNERLSVGLSGLQRCFIARATATSSGSASGSSMPTALSFTDTSAWYWSSLLGRSRGPWLATTRAAPARFLTCCRQASILRRDFPGAPPCTCSAGFRSCARLLCQRSVRPPMAAYAELQAARGKQAFGQYCVECHHGSLRGSAHGPALVGSAFAAHWNAKTTANW
jgi:hypothetical protein